MTSPMTLAAVALMSVLSLVSVTLGACGGSDGSDDGSASDASVTSADGGSPGTTGAGSSADATTDNASSGGNGDGNGGGGGNEGGGGGSPSSDAAGSTDGGGARGSAGCGVKTAEAGTFTVDVSLADGGARTYDVVVPAAYQPGVPAPLAFVFHGAGGTSKQAEGYGLQEAAAAANQAGIFAFPQGTTDYGSSTGWDDFSCSSPDTALFDAIVAHLEASFCIDPDRIFASGFSWGGDFTNVLGACRGSVLRAVAVGSGGYYIKVPAEDVAYRFTYGTKDNEYSQAQLAAGLQQFHDANHCSDAGTSIAPSPCLAYSGCDHPVDSCVYEGMGHQLPTGWGADTWAFFETFR